MSFKNVPMKKILLILFIVFLSVYVLWDISRRAMNRLRIQGYTSAINKIMTQVETCKPISIFSEEKQANLIDIGCLKAQPEGVMKQPEGVMKQPEGVMKQPEGVE